MTDKNTLANINRDLFEKVFSLNAKGLLVYAGEFLSSKEEAEDIVSDVFVNLWEKIDTISADNIRHYLFSSVRNRCLNYLSHLKVRSVYQEKLLKESNLDYSYFDLYVENELRDYINAAIDKLPSRQKQIFRMNKLEKKSYAEIAGELAISPKTVDNHLQAASKLLRKYIPKNLYLLYFASLVSTLDLGSK